LKNDIRPEGTADRPDEPQAASFSSSFQDEFIARHSPDTPCLANFRRRSETTGALFPCEEFCPAAPGSFVRKKSGLWFGFRVSMAVMQIDLKRSEYDRGKLDLDDLKTSPFEQFAAWFGEVRQGQVMEPNAMSLATAGADGRPLVRTVLLKTYDERGFVFFTNLESRKARQIQENPNASLLFPWLALQRQVIISGRVEKVSTAETLAYFVTRPRGSQIGAWISQQSSVVTSRQLLETQWEEMKNKFAGDEVPLPSWWGGYRVVPRDIEFWQGRVNRLHDRFLYTAKEDGTWSIDRLAP
jgi:pyridoxamine 5'-phosphate oxidase